MRVFPLQHTSTSTFYGEAVDLLKAAGIDFLVGGAYALRTYTEVERDTKDFDLMMKPQDVPRAIEAFRAAGFRADYAFTHWLAKVHRGEYFIDIVFRAGNGLCDVDDSWFEAATEGELFGRTMKFSPVEEMIWQKAYIMERERFDGADVIHLVRNCGKEMDWDRLIRRFGADWRVLFSHLLLFGFVYPGERDTIPARVMHQLIERFASEVEGSPDSERVCRGTLLSRAQYLADVERLNYADVRQVEPRVHMTAAEILDWTNAIDRDQRPR